MKQPMKKAPLCPKNVPGVGWGGVGWVMKWWGGVGWVGHEGGVGWGRVGHEGVGWGGVGWVMKGWGGCVYIGVGWGVSCRGGPQNKGPGM